MIDSEDNLCSGAILWLLDMIYGGEKLPRILMQKPLFPWCSLKEFARTAEARREIWKRDESPGQNCRIVTVLSCVGESQSCLPTAVIIPPSPPSRRPVGQAPESAPFRLDNVYEIKMYDEQLQPDPTSSLG